MLPWIAIALVLLAAKGAVAAPPLQGSPRSEASAEEVRAAEAPSPTATAKLEERNGELLRRHAEIWGLMGLSAKVQEELNGIVVSINTAIHENEARGTELLKQVVVPRRSDQPRTYESFVSSHKRRFGLLRISGPAQAELLAALDFTWKALHDPDVPEERREVAEKIRDLMKSMGGPPPCCDDGIFERAGMEVSGP
jgi:hypothetical protein